MFTSQAYSYSKADGDNMIDWFDWQPVRDAVAWDSKPASRKYFWFLFLPGVWEWCVVFLHTQEHFFLKKESGFCHFSHIVDSSQIRVNAHVHTECVMYVRDTSVNVKLSNWQEHIMSRWLAASLIYSDKCSIMLHNITNILE